MISTALILRLLAAISVVESNNNDLAVGDQGTSLGRYQMRSEALQDVNEMFGFSYAHHELTNPETARVCALSYLRLQSYRHPRQAGPLEYLARCWNGGPEGYYKAATLPYWRKVRAELSRQEAAANTARKLKKYDFKLETTNPKKR